MRRFTSITAAAAMTIFAGAAFAQAPNPAATRPNAASSAESTPGVSSGQPMPTTPGGTQMRDNSVPGTTTGDAQPGSRPGVAAPSTGTEMRAAPMPETQGNMRSESPRTPGQAQTPGSQAAPARN